jgi:hypothetical protein
VREPRMVLQIFQFSDVEILATPVFASCSSEILEITE